MIFFLIKETSVSVLRLIFVATGLLLCGSALAQTNPITPLSLRDAIHTALRNNRLLQIERINPELARATLSTAWAAYDPVFTAQADTENTSDAGGFDPADPNNDAVYSAKSEVVRASLIGLLPSGLSYTINADYAYAAGTRNFLNFESYRLTANATARQPLLRNFWIDQPRYLIRVNRNNIKINEHGVRFVAMDVVSQVRQAYAELAFGWENLRVQQDLLRARQTFLRGIQRQIEVGGAFTVLEERTAQSQEASVRTTLIAASNAVAMAANNLKTLLGYSATNWTPEIFSPTDSLIVVPRRFHLVTSWDRGLIYRPDLAQLNWEARNAHLNVKYRRNQLFPSLDIFGSYGRRGSSSLTTFPPDPPRASFGEAWGQLERGDVPSDTVGLILTFPLTMSGERASFRESKLLRHQAELRVKEKEELIMREIADAIQFAQSSYDRLQSAREASRFAELALAAEEEKLAGGRSSVLFVLQLQNDLSNARTAEIEAKRDYNFALTQLDLAEGTILDHENIGIEVK
jgi:outer membrane protein